MGNELQGKMVEILTGIQSAVGKASDFALAQLPDVAQSYIAYGRATETIQFVSFVLALSVCVFIACKYGYLNRTAVQSGGYNEGEWMFSRMMASIFGTLGAFIFFVVAVVEVGSVAMVWLAPKVWLLKELAHFLR